MILYHGSYIMVENPDLEHSRKKVDFGAGFYTTPIYAQALKWCERFKRQGQKGVISFYDFDENCGKNLDILRFESYSEEWLEFISDCRKGLDRSTHDMVVGGVANDKVFDTVELYFDGLIGKKEAIGRLMYEQPNQQNCFRTKKALDCLSFLKGEII